MPGPEIRVRGLKGIPEIRPGDDLANLILEALRGENQNEESFGAGEGIIFVVAQKAVSKAEGRIVGLGTVIPSERAQRWARLYGRDARIIEVVLEQSQRLVRMDRGIIIAETRHGFVCANAGVDSSNAPRGSVILLPEDPDRSARLLRERLQENLRRPVAVIVSDTFGRPWRQGLTNVALGVSGLSPFIDYRGRVDSYGRPLQATLLAVADELAAASELVMGKTAGIPVAMVEGFRPQAGNGSGAELIRPAAEDLFR